ncbi:polysaccharide deacetylase family protein [Xylophilus rhododendri]|uniref:Polysaccharide deacetylase family protein n=1 Tax=Xylophilus rhododendri TaxID=2697032 RepID=A0A857J4K6_9BURK|nr:polysaccharide deacetylase family protein [Xylophilus rhododendri]QHI97798.1 polysaccharide deacetylase family protein [Xylophilus rhododendri]
MSHTRDFSGYRWNYPSLRWPGDAGLALSFVLNVEEGAEFSLSAGDERNEGRHEVNHEIVGVPDLCMESQFEYGARVGYWRITRMLMDAGVPLTLNACGRALEATPWIAGDAVEQGFEICCHGWRWESHAGMQEAEERERIARTAATVTRLTGRAPVGWHTKSSASPNTRRLLAEHGGFLYDSDAYNDDLPYYLAVAGRPHLVLPYAFDTNDMRFFDSFAYVRGDDFADYAIDAFECLLEESRHAPRMMSIGLHTRIIGRPGRIGGLRKLLAHIAGRQGVWCATREQIARHWLATVPPDALATGGRP